MIFPLGPMSKTRSQELSEKADSERQRCRTWLGQFMLNGLPKFCAKEELRSVAMKELNVSKSSFDVAWDLAIHDTGREDWYEPTRSRKKPTAQ